MDTAQLLRIVGRLAGLIEADRELLPAANVATGSRAALASLAEVLARLARGEDTTATDDAAVAEAVAFLETEISHDETRRALQAAIKATRPSGEGFYTWVRDVFDTRFIWEDQTPTGVTLWEQPYTLDDAGKAILGDPVKVRAQTVYVAEAGGPPGDVLEAIEAGEIVVLAEAKARADGIVPIRVIRPGWGTSGYYPADVLKRDGPKSFPKGTQMFWDHPTRTEEAERPERSVRDLAAVTVTAPVWQDKGPAGPGLYADAQVMAPYREVVSEIAPHIGLSIRALGRTKAGEAEGRKGPVVESIIAGQSIDFVTRAGAGGQVVALFEAARGRAESVSVITEEVREVSEQEIQEARLALEQVTRERDEARAEAARLRETAVLREARDLAADALGKADLPEITRTRLVESLAKDPPTRDGALDREAFAATLSEAVKAEAAYLAAVTRSGTVRGLGAGPAGGTQTPEAEMRLEAAFGRLGLSESAAKAAATGRS